MAADGSTPSPDDDTKLMLAARDGDEAAFALLVRRWQDRIVSLAFRYLGSAADAEDLAQEVFLRVHRARRSYEPSAKFSTWIYRIAGNASLNHLRARRARRGVAAPMPADPETGEPLDAHDATQEDPAATLEKSELAQVLRRIVDGLPDRQRLAIVLNKYEGRSYEEVAEAMELSVMAVKSLLTRARVTIRDELEPYLTTGTPPAEGDR